MLYHQVKGKEIKNPADLADQQGDTKTNALESIAQMIRSNDETVNTHTGSEWQELNSQRRLYLLSDFCKFSLPYTNPGDDKAEWVRVNGNRQIVMHPRTVVRKGQVRHLWAYGKIARLLLIWICTQVQRQKNTNATRTIMLPSTLRELMSEMGIRRKPTKADYERFRNQIRAIVSFHAEITEISETPHSIIERTPPKLELVEQAEIRWEQARAGDGSVQEGSYITLTPDTWERMTKSRPLDADMVEVLTTTGKGQDLDVYCWLTQRIYDLNGSKAFTTRTVSWRQLADQFGAQYSRLGNFVSSFKKSFLHVAFLWPQLRYRIIRGEGISLMRSPLTVHPMRREQSALSHDQPQETQETDYEPEANDLSLSERIEHRRQKRTPPLSTHPKMPEEFRSEPVPLPGKE
ncbi:MAG: hypothetical protein L0K38_12275 [Yaniella sp.]|uniref:replication protein RepA n=1 Tax=Actinomycetes TaxID=1760 RepID=UPI00264A4804|nr:MULTISPECIES: replication protein RepA [Actinomycetes]MDN6457804.1 hypothetical protein [Yaniella sp.]MDN6468300.1 hypothetical protein [Bifidobacterium crudilactis]